MDKNYIHAVLKEDELMTIFAAHILQSLEQGTKDELITEAIKRLMAPTRSQYGNPKPSLMEEAFVRISESVMNEVVRELLLKDEVFIGKIRSFCEQALDKMLGSEKFEEVAVNEFVRRFMDRIG